MKYQWKQLEKERTASSKEVHHDKGGGEVGVWRPCSDSLRQRREEEERLCLDSFLLSTQSRTHALAMVPSTFRMGRPSSTDLIKIILRKPRGRFHGDSRACQADNQYQPSQGPRQLKPLPCCSLFSELICFPPFLFSCGQQSSSWHPPIVLLSHMWSYDFGHWLQFTDMTLFF